MPSTTAASAVPRATTSGPAALRLVCWLLVLVEGYDLVVLGAVIPTWLEGSVLGFTGSSTTFVATLSLVGVAIGATALGPLSDRVGRRPVLIASVASFSVLTGLIAVASSIEMIAALRLLSGIGLGAGLPVVLAVAAENTSAQRRSRATTYTMTGYHLGAVAASLLALQLLPEWRPLFLIGGALGLLLLPALWVVLPRERQVLDAAQGTVTGTSSARAMDEEGGPGVLVRPPLRRMTLAAWVVSFMGLLLVYGLNTWLPPLMRDAGYDLGTSVQLLLVLNVGAVIGLLVAGPVADRWGSWPTMLLWFAGAAVGLALLSVPIDTAVLLNALVLVTGALVFSAQVVLYAHVSRTVPDAARGSALGLAAGVGRLGAIVGPLVTGALVTAGHAYPWGFYLFAAVALLAVAAAVLTRVPDERATE